jgi:hypothetical protein
MAMRRVVIEAALAFPERILMHDSWIGLVSCAIGKAKYLDEDLLQYRRRNQNVTGVRHAGMKKIDVDQWHVLICFIQRYVQLRQIGGREGQ